MARFLIAKKGRRHFVDYVGKGLQNESQTQVLRAWDQATQEFYQYKDLSELQVDWLAWVKNGSKESQPRKQSELNSLAKSQPNFRGSTYAKSNNKDNGVVAASFVELTPENQTTGLNQTDRLASKTKSASEGEVTDLSNLSSSNQTDSAQNNFGRNSSKSSNSWYVREMNREQTIETLLDRQSPTANADRVASGQGWQKTNQARKVPSNELSGSKPPVEHDSRLPQAKFRPPPATLWR